MALAVEVAFVALFACFAGVASLTFERPHISTLIPYNPTETTIVWAKPFCVFSSGSTANLVKVYATITNNSYAFGNIGTTFSNYWTNVRNPYPYEVGTFNLPNCINQPNFADPMAIKNDGVFRLGSNTTCVNNIESNASVCNGPLIPGMAYRVKYALLENSNTNTILDETPWSDAITTKKLPSASTINTWPGKRTGGMVVVTSVLSTLLFLLLAALLLVVIFKACSSNEQDLVKPTEVEAPPVRGRHSSYKTHYTNKGYGEENNSTPAKPERYQ